jgi:GTP-binding protein
MVDSVTLIVKAGDGKSGASTFLSAGAKAGKGGPDGGNGGNGGNIYIQGSNNIYDLREFRFKKKVEGSDGIAGKRQKLHGRNAEHTVIKVPLGTRVTDHQYNRVYEITDPERMLLIAKGGIGGRGNAEFKSATNQAPKYAEQGTKGQEKTIQLELRLIAEIGLIGLPNAGKSSLLSVLTNATPKIGDYQFTTLEPNIGMLDGHLLADIPGLIEGASSGRGLGVTFLKHIEKTRFLVHCIEATNEDPLTTYNIVRNEFSQYNKELLEKPEIILLTKTDLVSPEELKPRIRIFTRRRKKVFTCSLYDEEAIQAIKAVLLKYLEELGISV